MADREFQASAADGMIIYVGLKNREREACLR